ncbi:MAG: CHASE3 domain-containing protein [Blastocatellia bacterium]|nr:CHASE3 domain-containing protein [Blastocatellia bacterium]
MKWSVGTKIAAGYALALLMLLTIGMISYRNTGELVNTNQLEKHTYQVLEKTELLISLLKDAESGQRGYIITGNESYLEPYNLALDNIDKVFLDLEKLVIDNPAQQNRLNLLRPLIDNRMSIIKELVLIRKDKGLEATVPLVLQGKGKETMDSIRKLIADIKSEETSLLVQRTKEAELAIASTFSTIIYGIPLAALLLFFIGILITRNITGPLSEISLASEKIAGGELNISLQANTIRKDEVGVLAQTFNYMSKSLYDTAKAAEEIANGNLSIEIKPQSEKDIMTQSLVKMLKNLHLTTTQIQQGTAVISSSTTQMLASISQTASAALETATAINETVTTIEEVKQTSQFVNQQTKMVAESSQKAVQVSKIGEKSVDDTVAMMNQLREQTEMVASNVVKLSEQSQAIGNIITTVNDLADQSNILAINAAIEAARAGEQGRGFAVVAQEVKNLADQSKTATKEIQTIVVDIQKATNLVVMSMEKASKAVETSVKQSMNAGESIKSLAKTIAENAKSITQITVSAQEQSIGMDQLSLAMQNIKEASEQNVIAMKQAELTVKDLDKLGNTLKELIRKYQP